MVLALFIVTLLAGLAVKFGLHRFSVGLLLNIWFVVAVVLPTSYRADRIKTTGWDQALAWLIGSAVWIAFIGHRVVGTQVQMAATSGHRPAR